ncbi:DsbA family protein [Candidatus Woesearchaeota archaeon]|nr:DsbA family protein [Candidatus Woesearchaeota archaeon]
MVKEEDIIFAITKQNVWKVTTTVLLILVVAFIVKDELGGSAGTNLVQPTQQNAPAAAQGAVVPVSADDDAVLGDPNAPVTVIEFSDFECPFCGRAYEDAVKQMKKEYVETGKVKFVYRDYPLSFHPQAQKAAEAAECAGDQGKYWEMHDKLFENQQSLSVENHKKWAAELGLNSATFNDCLDSGKNAEEVQKDSQDGNAAGVSGTPTFYINGQELVGAVPYAQLKAVIESKLSE